MPLQRSRHIASPAGVAIQSPLGARAQPYRRSLVVAGHAGAPAGAVNYGRATGNTEGIYRTDGVTVSPFGDGLGASNPSHSGPGGDAVEAVGRYGGALVAGGSFTHPTQRIAIWNPYSQEWDSLGPGIPNGTVRAITEHDGDLIVGGDFTEVDGDSSASRIARWDGTSWHAMDGGFDSTVFGNDGVFSLLSDGSDLYAGGLLERGGDINGTFRWDGSSWSEVESLGRTRALTRSAGHLYAAAVDDIFRLDTANDEWEHWWRADDLIYALIDFDGDLIAGGDFTEMRREGGSDVSADYIARLSGVTVTPLAGLDVGAGNSVTALTVWRDRLVANLTPIGDGVAYWSETNQGWYELFNHDFQTGAPNVLTVF